MSITIKYAPTPEPEKPVLPTFKSIPIGTPFRYDDCPRFVAIKVDSERYLSLPHNGIVKSLYPNDPVEILDLEILVSVSK